MSSKNKNKARKPQDFQQKKQVTSASNWASSNGSSSLETDLELPSGNVCRVRRTDMPTLLASGAFPDSLMAIVSEKIGTATGKKDKPKELGSDEVAAVMGDPDKMAELFQSIDKLIPIVVVQPAVQNHNWIDPVTKKAERALTDNERQAIRDEFGDVLFTDQVDLEDKMYIFQFVVGGKRDVEAFRGELGAVVGDLSAN